MASPVASGVSTDPITLGPGAEPAGETGGGAQGPHGDLHADLTVDLGFFHPYSIGNRVWIDRNNTGTLDAGDGPTPGAAGVVVRLLHADGTPVLDSAGDPVTTTTNANGFYRFDNLIPGDYRVRIVATNFDPAGPLADHISSPVTTADPNGDADSDDNGVDDTAPATNAIMSEVVTLGDAAEPLGDLAGGTGHGAGGDSRSNLTVDFGFLKPFSVGNRVWKDLDDSGTINTADGASPGIAGVTVSLTDAAGNPAKDVFGVDVARATTDADGFFRFDNLAPGTFKVCAERANFTAGALRGMMSSTTTEGSPDLGVDANDNGIDQAFPATTGVCAAVVTLGPGDEPTAESDTAAAAGAQGPHGDAHANLTVDLGFFTPNSLGNRVWNDLDDNGQVDPGEAGIGDVLVNLLDAAGNPAVDAAGNLVPQAITNAGGFFRFDNLPPGDYIAELSPDSFQSGNPLFTMRSSTTTEADPDANVDGNDNGIDTADPATTGIRTGVVTLGPPAATEPTGDLGGAASHGPHGDAQGNLTVDFGLFLPLSVGNRIWADIDNDGVFDATTESGIANVSVRLTDTAGNDVGSADGSAGPTSLTTTTDANGFFLFPVASPGDYKVLVEASNFAPGGPLHLHTSSTPTFDPNADVDANDDGANALDPAATGVRTGVITLGPGDEPLGDLGGGPGHGSTGDARSNLTVDLGFLVPYTLGNRVWLDADNEGDLDSGEIGVENVTVALRDAAGNPVQDVFGNPVANVTTGADGFFRFVNLGPGDYTVVLVKANFSDGGVLEHLVTSAPTAANPNDDVDADDNGLASDPVTSGITSGVVTLGPDDAPPTVADGEPLGDLGGQVDHSPTIDSHTNLTVDFALYGPYSIGNRVWRDLDNNGRIDAGEPGIGGVVIDVLLPDGTVIGTAAPTDASGFWRIDGLAPGTFKVKVARSSFAPGGPLFEHHSSVPTTANPNLPDPDNTDSDDNGIDSLDPALTGILTNGVALGATPPYGDDEPLGDLGGGPGHGPNGDVHSNLTLDLGFYPLARIGNLVWDDRNHDGVQDPGEPRLPGVTVKLLIGGGVVATTTTDARGEFAFSGLIPGEYQLLVVPPAGGWEGTLQRAPGSDTAADSDLDPASLVTTVTTLGVGESDETQDIGLWRPASIGDRVWHDVNANGIQDPTEVGLGGVRVVLLAGGAPLGETTTAPDGSYRFDKLVPSSYQVEFFAPVGWALSWPGWTTDVAIDSDPDRTSHRTPVIAIDPGEQEATVDAGVHEAATLRGIVWWDRNQNGRRDESEPVAPLAKVWVTDPAGHVVAEAMTDQNGSYEFSNLAVGFQYTVHFTPPKGWVLGVIQDQKVVLQPGEQRNADDTPIVRPTELSITGRAADRRRRSRPSPSP